MIEDLPIWILEPEPTEKRNLWTKKLYKGRQKTELITEAVSIDDIKKQLKEVRQYSRDNISELVEEFKANISKKYPQVTIKSASDSIEAVRYIKEISDGIDTISVNNSQAVVQELKPGLIANGFTVIDSYFDEIGDEEIEGIDYLGLPKLVDNNPIGSFSVSIKMAGINSSDANGTKKYLAVLGVNAISVDDGTAFFLQHYHNIYNDLTRAQKTILVVGLDKIVRNREDAAFQTKCMGIFGVESMLLGIHLKPGKTPSIAELELPAADKEKELHIIILDSGRMKLLETKFRDLFLCIGCRACNKLCPIRHSFADTDYIWTPRNYLSQLLYGTRNSIDICLHCEACRMECPIDIDLPQLMWQAKIDHVKKHGRPFYHKILGAPELLAQLGTAFAPVANRLMAIKLVRVLVEIITGIDRKTILPRFHFRTFRKWFRENA